MNLQMINKTEILGKEIQVYGDFDNPLFLAKSVANWIEHSNPTLMLKSVDEEEKLMRTIFHGGQNRRMCFLTEDGMKQVLANSRKSIAREILLKLEKNFLYKNTPKQVEFELMLKNALDIHLNKSNLDWKYCPFNNKKDYMLTYDNSVFYETEKTIGKYRVDFYFPKFNLIVEYDEKHHDYQKEKDKMREVEIIKILEKVNDFDISENNYLTNFIRVKNGEEFDGIIKIISYLMHYAFAF